MTWTIIAASAFLLTVLSLKWTNLAYSITATLAWVALWVYNLTNPLTNVTQGTLLYDLIFYGILLGAVGTMVAWIINRRRGYTGYPLTASEQRDFNEELKGEREEKSLSSMSIDEYKREIHRRRVRG